MQALAERTGALYFLPVYSVLAPLEEEGTKNARKEMQPIQRTS